MFSQAHNFIINDGHFTVHNQTETDKQKNPAGYFPGMTHCPTSTAAFTGREDILAILEQFFFPGHAAERTKVFHLHGLGGVGKTQTALEFRRKFKARFTAIYFITADKEYSLQGGYLDIARANVTQAAESWEAGLSWLKTHEQNWLVIIDNADDPNIQLANYLPACDHGNIIITSRNPELKHVADQDHELRDMLPNDGILLLLKHALKDHSNANQQQKEEAAKIAIELHYFPLALVQAGAYINQTQCLFEYLERLEHHREQLLRKNLNQARDKYHWSVYQTWILSWEQLRQESKVFLSLCAHLHHEHIPRLLFERGVMNINHMVHFGPSNAVKEGKLILESFSTLEMKWDGIKFDDIIAEIASYSLVNIDNGGYMFHPLVHQWLKDMTKEENKQAIEGIIVLAFQGTFCHDHKFWQRLLPHCRALGDLNNSDYTVRFIIGLIWFHLDECQEAIMLWEPLLSTVMNILGVENNSTVHLMSGLGMAYYSTGKATKALELLQNSIAIFKRVMGEEHPTTLYMIRGYSMILLYLERTNEALVLLQPAVEIAKRVIGDEHPLTLTMIESLSKILSGLGRKNEALILLQSLVEISKRVMGTENLSTLARIEGLAEIFNDLERGHEALEILQHLAENSRRVMGEEHPNTLNIIHASAVTLIKMKRPNEALKLFQTVAETSKRVLGDEHPQTFSRIKGSADTLYVLGRKDEALELLWPLVEISKRVIADEHPDFLSGIKSLADTLCLLERRNEALELLLPLVEISKRVLGDEHPQTLSRIKSLADTLWILGRINEALQLLQPLVEISKRVLGDEHPQTLSNIQGLAETLCLLGRIDEALELLLPLVEISKRVIADEHPQTLFRIKSLADTLCILGRINEAL
ncbi:P-loop containing nucleoside triphosphate hydrolase protein, partial [Lentinula detonsa]